MIQKIDYKIDKKKYNVIFTDNILPQLNNIFKKINSDYKVCLVYDENIDNKIINELARGLKITGSFMLQIFILICS